MLFVLQVGGELSVKR